MAKNEEVFERINQMWSKNPLSETDLANLNVLFTTIKGLEEQIDSFKNVVPKPGHGLIYYAFFDTDENRVRISPVMITT